MQLSHSLGELSYTNVNHVLSAGFRVKEWSTDNFFTNVDVLDDIHLYSKSICPEKIIVTVLASCIAFPLLETAI